MTNFLQELVKIALGNLLFGVILVLVTYFLNRKMEFLKASNAYIQKLAEARINAYQEIAELLGKIVAHVTIRSNIMTNKNNTIEYEEILKQSQSRSENFLNDCIALASAVCKYGMHISNETRNSMQSLLGHISVAAEYFDNVTLGTETQVDMTELAKSWQVMYDKVIKEVLTNPYH